MFESFGIIDFIDIALASALLLYLYLTMKKSGAINVFLGIVFLLVVFTVLRISRMTLMKGIFDTIISQGVIILIILFQNEIRHFLSDVGSNRSLRFFKRFMHKPSAAADAYHLCLHVDVEVENRCADCGAEKHVAVRFR